MHLRMCSFYNKLEGSNGGKERQNRVPYRKCTAKVGTIGISQKKSQPKADGVAWTVGSAVFGDE